MPGRARLLPASDNARPRPRSIAASATKRRKRRFADRPRAAARQPQRLFKLCRWPPPGAPGAARDRLGRWPSKPVGAPIRPGWHRSRQVLRRWRRRAPARAPPGPAVLQSEHLGVLPQEHREVPLPLPVGRVAGRQLSFCSRLCPSSRCAPSRSPWSSSERPSMFCEVASEVWWLALAGSRATSSWRMAHSSARIAPASRRRPRVAIIEASQARPLTRLARHSRLPGSSAARRRLISIDGATALARRRRSWSRWSSTVASAELAA